MVRAPLDLSIFSCFFQANIEGKKGGGIDEF